MNEPVIVPPRRSLTRRQRVKLFDLRGGICGICRIKIKVGEPGPAGTAARDQPAPEAGKANHQRDNRDHERQQSVPGDRQVHHRAVAPV